MKELLKKKVIVIQYTVETILINQDKIMICWDNFV